jgi:chromatin assembly factor 1 subunit B
MVLIWIPSDGPTSSFGSALDDDGDAEFTKEHWRLRTMARASSSEIYDMAWSPSGDSLVIGGTDFVARIINAHDGELDLTRYLEVSC